MIENNHLVTIKYEVSDKESAEVLDKSDDFKFIIGQNQVICGLENALMDKKIGDKFKVEVAPKDAYGERNGDFLQEVPKEQFAGIELVQGMTLYGQSEDGEMAQVVVAEIGENSVIIDYNHPLAGKTLLFEVEILDSKVPNDDEILELHRNSAHHHCGGGEGCCGGEHHTESGCGCGH
ncbi:FKBP-type peptidyl-prolyl cis-trans isomerase [Helicobacter sp. 23-1045]